MAESKTFRLIGAHAGNGREDYYSIKFNAVPGWLKSEAVVTSTINAVEARRLAMQLLTAADIIDRRNGYVG